MSKKNLKPNFLIKFLFLLTILYFQDVTASPGRSDVVIAVIDSGLNLSHPNFSKHLWQNPGEIADNNIDDDNNGYVDDVHGWDFVADNDQIIDVNGHGTHVSGLILGWPFSTETAGPIKLMPLRYYEASASGSLNLSRSVDALRYAIEAGADIINYSGGGIMPDPREESLIRLAAHKGILVVSAAGNHSFNLDIQGFYPASYNSKSLFTVAAMTKSGHLLKASNYGKKVHFVALGEDVESALPHQNFGAMTGTSQATALVTRAIALLIFDRPELKRSPENIPKMLSKTLPASELALKTPAAKVVLTNLKSPQKMSLLFQ